MKAKLIEKLNAGTADAQDLAHIEKLIELGELDINEIPAFTELLNLQSEFPVPEPGDELSVRFYSALQKEKSKSSRKIDFSSFFSSSPLLKFAVGLGLVILGVFIAPYLNNESAQEINQKEISMLTEEITNMKEVMMLSLLEKESTSERLKAVNLTSEMNTVSDQVTQALFRTLNNDENVNVRLAALEAIYPYSKNAVVRKQLVESIGHQDSPMVQVALAEIMVALQEKDSIDPLKQILQKDNTPEEIKSRIRESIETII